MTPSKLSKSVLSQIEEKHIAPLPKWRFVVRNILWWILFATSVVLGGMGVAVIMFAAMHQRFDFGDFFEHGGVRSWLGMLPVFWLFFFALFIWFSFWGITHTKKAYRIPRFLLILTNLFLTVVVGVLFYTSKQAEHFEEAIIHRIPHMKTIRERREERWHRIGDGFLAGKIEEVRDGEVLLHSKQEDQFFTIDVREADTRGGFVLEKGEHARFVGEQTSETTFQALRYGPFAPEKIRERRKEHQDRLREKGHRPPSKNGERRAGSERRENKELRRPDDRERQAVLRDGREQGRE